MPYTRRYRRRRVSRKRIYRRKWSRKRSARKFTNDGKRFFKLKTADPCTSTPTGEILNAYYNNPSLYADFTQLSALFDSIKVCAIKIRYIPTNPNYVVASSVTAFQPAYVVHDKDSNTAPAALSDYIQYENCKIKDMSRPWSYYTKFARQLTAGVAGQVIMAGGYTDIGNITNTQGIFIRSEPGYASNSPVGRYLTTLYVVCKNRR